jgi:hypothetical protein
MTYGWNPSPDDPWRGDAAPGDLADDPGLQVPYGEPDGPGDDDRTWARGPAAGQDRAPGPGGPPVPYDARTDAGTWTGGNHTGASAVAPSHWQPGYEPLGHSRPGLRGADAAAGWAVARGDTRQRAASAWDAWPDGGRRDSARSGKASAGAGARGDARGQPPHPPQDDAPVSYLQEDADPRTGQDSAWHGYRPLDAPGDGSPQAQDYRSPGAVRTGAPAGEDAFGSGHAAGSSVFGPGVRQPGVRQPGVRQPGDRGPGVREPGDRWPGAADVISYGYPIDPADTSGRHPSEAAAGSAGTSVYSGPGGEPGWLDQPRWVSGPVTRASGAPASGAPAGAPAPRSGVPALGGPRSGVPALGGPGSGAPGSGAPGSGAPGSGAQVPGGLAPGAGGSQPDWLAQPDWFRGSDADEPGAGGPEPGEPEFVLYGPDGSRPHVRAGRAHPSGDGRRAVRRGRGRLWLGIGAVLVIVVAAGAFLYGRLGRISRPAPPAAPSHTLATPQTIGAYTRDEQAEQQLALSHNEQYVTQIDPGHVSGIVSAVYDTGGPASSPDHVAVIAGKLVNSPIADVIKSFNQQESAEGNAPMAVPAGPLGGRAACAGKGTSGICLWADGNTVGVLVSATINASSLAREMLTIRPGIEVPAT